MGIYRYSTYYMGYVLQKSWKTLKILPPLPSLSLIPMNIADFPCFKQKLLILNGQICFLFFFFYLLSWNNYGFTEKCKNNTKDSTDTYSPPPLNGSILPYLGFQWLHFMYLQYKNRIRKLHLASVDSYNQHNEDINLLSLH